MRMRVIALAALCLVVAACGSPDPNAAPGASTTSTPPASSLVPATTTPAPPSTGTIQRCRDVGLPSAPSDWYRDSPKYVENEMPVEAVRAWATSKPGYLSIWIDREHNGWVAVSFSENADKRQAELEQEFPDDGVVAVPVDWTHDSLRDLEKEINDELSGVVEILATSSEVERGVVSIYLEILTEESLTAIAERIDVEHVCVEGLEPEDVVPAGPQPEGGDGWRLLFDGDERGTSYSVGLAWDERSLQTVLREALRNVAVEADFASEIVIVFGAVHGSSCPHLRLDDVVAEGGYVYSVIVNTDNQLACTDDAIPHTYIVAFERDHLPAPPFQVRLSAPDPENPFDPGAILVEADLRPPGSVAGQGEIGPVPEPAGSGAARSGAIIEVGFPWQYEIDLSCGLESLGELNWYQWVARDSIPDAWVEATEGEDSVVVEVTVNPGPEPTVDVRFLGETVVYEPSDDEMVCNPSR